MQDKIGITEGEFIHEFGYEPQNLTGAEIQQYLLTGAEIQAYLLTGAKGIEGAQRRFPTRVGKEGAQGNREALVLEQSAWHGSPYKFDMYSRQQNKDPFAAISFKASGENIVNLFEKANRRKRDSLV
jgi:hypothetical protein